MALIASLATNAMASAQETMPGHWASTKLLTRTTTSLATKAKISEQETIPGQAFSSFSLMPSMVPNPLKLRFGIASFSAGLLLVPFNRTEPSHPCKMSTVPSFIIIKNSWKDGAAGYFVFLSVSKVDRILEIATTSSSDDSRHAELYPIQGLRGGSHDVALCHNGR
ncbi:hypothetical protein IEQ34_011116 [Dendrobium chrysotoxum]|uniref:Uncharacterized protein n=1 Tax=Dendrobium chrysotoxum TaxID=161865 RepID=A0AAV7GXU4_DENCH|nr:hypothetical protein IEQ34_011116 [Dendrobium chrysotoxum]